MSRLWRIIYACLAMLILCSATAPPTYATTAYSSERTVSDGIALEKVEASTDNSASTSITSSTPQSVVRDKFDSWLVGDEFVYWAQHCTIGESGPYLLSRKPRAGGAEATIENGNSNACDRYRGMATDSSGLYYFSKATGQIEAVPITSPNGPSIPLLPDGIETIVGRLVLDNERIYWATEQEEIVYIPKSGGEPPVHLITASGSVRDMAVTGSHIYWLDDEGIWWADKACQQTPCDREQILALQGGRSFTLGTGTSTGMPYHIYLWQAETPNVRLLHLPPATPGTGQTEVLYETSRLAFPSGLIATQMGSSLGIHLYWAENPDSIFADRSSIYRLSLEGGQPEEIYFTEGKFIQLSSFTDSTYLYFATQSLDVDPTDPEQIFEYPLDADGIQVDISLAGFEITQAVQNLENEVPLVADKPTYVRAYGQLAGTEVSAGSVVVKLEGSRNGLPLPGSPLWPTNGTFQLMNGDPIDRTDASVNWMFEMPKSWLHAGTIDLTLTADPFEAYPDPNRANNSLSDSFTFVTTSKACIHSWPVLTEQPLPSEEDPGVAEMFNRLEQLVPISGSQLFPWGEPITRWGGRPFELDTSGAASVFWGPYRLMGKLVRKQTQFVATASVLCPRYALGVVHGATSSPARGVSLKAMGTMWVKFPEPNPSTATNWSLPAEGAVFAHEYGHLLDRDHINCSITDPDKHEFDIDPNYPYSDSQGNHCVLDDGDFQDGSTHFGFDTLNLDPIDPQTPADVMAVVTTAKMRWISDYTFRAMLERLLINPAQAQSTQTATAAGTAAEPSLLVSGFVDPEHNVGELDYIFLLPDGATNLDTVQGQFNVTDAHTATHDALTTRYHIRFLDAQGVPLADHDVTLQGMDHEVDIYLFADILPAFKGDVARVELMADNQVLAAQAPGMGQPSVTILEPTAKTKADDTLQLRWISTDPDADDGLLYNVEYSADGGTTWIPLISDYAGTPGSDEVSYTLQAPKALAGSPNALIRISASDGYNTGMAISEPFFIAQRAPKVHILKPRAEEWVEAGEVAPLHGAAYDAEDGTVPADALRWTVDNTFVGTGSQLLAKGFAPGSYPVRLQATDSSGRTAIDESVLNVATLELPFYNYAVMVDGSCDDRTYAGGTRLSLSPYSDGSQATVQFVRMRNELAVCLSNMQRTIDGPPTQAGIYVDIDHSREATAQSGDIGFLLGEDGTPSIVVGDGSGGFVPYTGNDYAEFLTRVSASANRWSAEFRLPVSTWDPIIGLLVTHRNVDNSGEDAGWPYRAAVVEPQSWATSAAANLPRIDTATPFSATVGTAAVTLEISGTHFAPNSTVVWNEQALATTFVNETLLTAVVDPAKLAVAGDHMVHVVTPGFETAPMPAHRFRVSYPQAEILALTPNSLPAGSATANITLTGTNFARDATVMLDGKLIPARWRSSTELIVTIPEAELVLEHDAKIRVFNPTPHQGGSNLFTLPITPAGLGFTQSNHTVYLPLVSR